MSLYVHADTDALTDAKLLAVGPLGFALYFKGLMYSKIHLTDGFVPFDALPLVGMGIPKLDSLIEKMVEKDLWSHCDGGYTVTLRRWQKFQTTKDDVEKSREEARKRKQLQRDRQRSGRDSGPNNRDVTPLSQRDMSHGHTTVTAPSETETETYIDKSILGVTVTLDGVTERMPDAIEIEDPASPPENEKTAKGKSSKPEESWDLDWLDFCEAYPKRSGDLNKSKGRVSFGARVREGATPGDIVAGARRYKSFCDLTGKTGTEYVKQMTSFLNQRCWLEIWNAPAPGRATNDQPRRLRDMTTSERLTHGSMFEDLLRQ